MPTAHVSLLRPVEAQIPSRRPKAPRSRQPRATVKPASLRISCKPIIPFTILPARFCSLIPPIAHNKTMPHSPLQLEPFSPRTAHAVRPEHKAGHHRPSVSTRKIPIPLSCAISSPFRPFGPPLRCKQTTCRTKRNTHPPSGNLPRSTIRLHVFGRRIRRFFAFASPPCAFPQTRYH